MGRQNGIVLTLSRGGVDSFGLELRMVKAFENAVVLCQAKAPKNTEPF
jgi:hypothetical protein